MKEGGELALHGELRYPVCFLDLCIYSCCDVEAVQRCGNNNIIHSRELGGKIPENVTMLWNIFTM